MKKHFRFILLMVIYAFSGILQSYGHSILAPAKLNGIKSFYKAD